MNHIVSWHIMIKFFSEKPMLTRFATFVSLSVMIAHFLASIASQTPTVVDQLSSRASQKKAK